MPGPAWSRNHEVPQPSFTGAMLRARHRAAGEVVDHESVDQWATETPGMSWDRVAADMSAALPGSDLADVAPATISVLVALYLAGFRSGCNTLASAIAEAGE